MSPFIPKADPHDDGPRDHIGAVRDFWSYLKEDKPHKWTSMALAITIPAVMIYGIYRGLIQPEPGPEIIYVESWPATRSQAEIEADWKERAEAVNARNAKRRAVYRDAADALGIEYKPAPGTEGGAPLETPASNIKADKPSPAPAAPAP